MKSLIISAALLLNGAAFAQSTTPPTDPNAGDGQMQSPANQSPNSTTQPGGRNSPMAQPQMAPGETTSSMTGTMTPGTGQPTGTTGSGGMQGQSTGTAGTGNMGTTGSIGSSGTMGSTGTDMSTGSPTQPGMSGTAGAMGSSGTMGSSSASGGTAMAANDYPICRSKSQDRCRQPNDARRAVSRYRPR